MKRVAIFIIGIFLFLVIVIPASRGKHKRERKAKKLFQKNLITVDDIKSKFTDTTWNGFFSSNDEVFECAIGCNYVDTYLSQNTYNNEGFAVLSNKRLYFKGNKYAKNGKKYVKKIGKKLLTFKTSKTQDL